jgi:hypothetical protein
MVILSETINIIVVHGKPPGVPTHKGDINLPEKIGVGIRFVQFERRLSQDGWFSHLGTDWMVNCGDDTLVIDGVG